MITLTLLNEKKNEAELTKKKSSLSHKPLSLTRLLSTTTQVKQQKKQQLYQQRTR